MDNLARKTNAIRKRDARRRDVDGSPSITSQCEECGATSDFPTSQDSTTQNCPKCNKFMDVGSLNWPADCDFEDVETERKEPGNADNAIDSAKKLDQMGDWDAVNVGRLIEVHSAYAAKAKTNNCRLMVSRELKSPGVREVTNCNRASAQIG